MSHRENAKNLDDLAKAIDEKKKFETTRCQAANTINLLNTQIQKLQQNDACSILKLKVIVIAFFLVFSYSVFFFLFLFAGK